MKYYDKAEYLTKSKKLKEAIEFCENELKEFSQTDFHWIINRNMLHHTDDLFTFIKTNFSDKSKLSKVKAFYSELNGFSINWDKWFLDVTAFAKLEDFQDQASDWLCDGFWGSYDPEFFEINGWEPLQKTFKEYHENEKYRDKQLSLIAELTEYLVVFRLQELFEKTITKGKALGFQWANVPWGITAHDYFLIYEI